MNTKISESQTDRPRVDTEADRKAFVRDWIARRLGSAKVKGAGLAGAVLSLPALAVAQGQGQDGFTDATQIEGVTSVEVMPDRSVQLEMVNGTTLSVPAQEVQVTAAGQVFVSERVIEIAADVMAAGAGAGAGGAALGGLAAAGAAAAAGGDGGSGGAGAPPPTINAGVLSAGGGLTNESTGVDLPDGTDDLEVTVTDEDGNETQLNATLNADGSWEADPDQGDDLPQGEVEVTVQSLDENGEEIDSQSQDVIIDTVPPEIDITDTGVGEDGVLNIAEQDAGITVSGTTDAADGQEVTVTLSTAAGDVVETTATANGGEWSADIAGGDLAGLADGDSVDVEATVADAAGNTASPATDSFDADLAGPEITIDDISDDNQIGRVDVNNPDGLDVTGTTTAEAGQEVTLTLDGQDYTGDVSAAPGGPNTWSVTVPQSALQALQDTAGADDLLPDIAVSATVSDAAGNPAQTPAATTIDADFSTPTIAIDPIAGDNVVNIAESGADVPISGTTTNVGDGQTVSVTVDGNALPDVQTNPDGTWTATLPQTDAAALPDSVDVTAEVTADGITSDSTVQLAADLTAPTVAINPVSGDNVITAADGGQPLTISGTSTDAAEGREVTVAGLPGVPDQTAAVDANGDWSLDLTAEQIDALITGQAGTALDITANLSDAAGNSAPEASADVDVYLASVFSVVNTAQAGQTLTMSAIAGGGLNSNDGVETTMTFDTAEMAYVPGSDDDNFDLFIVNDTDAASGSVIFTGGTTSDLLAEGDVMYRFDGTDQEAGPITLDFTDAAQGGPTELQLGTADADTLTSGNTDSVLQGRGGNDTLDVGDTGANVVVFQPDQAANGTDTVTGFTTGNSFQSDMIAFAGQPDLRGNGDTVESLGDSEALGADTGLVLFTTALADTDAGTLETAFEGLTGESAGDTVYFLAGDGNDAALARADVNGTDDASVELMAEFEGIGDLNALSADNVILPV